MVHPAVATGDGEILRFEAVTKRYGAVVALAGIDLTVNKGEFLTLLGPSGSGKTTLLNVIAGTVAPSSGRLWLKGRDITDVASSQRGLGMVFQNYALFPHMTIFENVAFALRVRRMSQDQIARKVAEVLEIVSLPHVAQRRPRELSGGQQQRIAIARCLVYNPDLILMDEPLGALDKKLREQLQLEIKRLHANLGVTILYVTHDQEEALVMSDRVCLMNAGQIEQLGEPHELYFQPATMFSADFLGESNIAPAASTDQGGVRMVATAAGMRFACHDAPPPGEPFSIMIRPENLTLHRVQASADALRGVVDEIIFSGGTTRIRVALGDGTRLSVTRLTSKDDREIDRGLAVSVGWSPSDIVILRG